MALVQWKMKNLQDEINDLLNMSFYPGTKGLFDRNESPAINVTEDDNNFKVICELPGVEAKDIDLSIASNVLTIKGEKREGSESKNKEFYRKETTYGAFQRTISLPKDVDNEKISAELKNGILYLNIAKKEEAKTKLISVEVK
ncbi:MAG: hypothetical protein B6229_09025 [Spirochaetaceae bacterium 4572_7]|nr:MAG: hypothetical protein B6229_09025 [Spirochaetaceae bacterium 4572_7]